MITLLMGENSYEIDRALQQLIRDFDGEVERYDGAELSLSQLPELVMGMSLFATERLVIIRQLSQQKALWDALPVWLERCSETIHLVLVEPKPDKRTATYKALQKCAHVQEYALWTERDSKKAEQWTRDEANQRGLSLAPSLVQLLVRRIGPDQWALHHALEKLALSPQVDEAAITQLIDAQPHENVFQLFETALQGNHQQLSEAIATLRRTEDPYKVLGLLAGQAFWLAVVATAPSSSTEAADFGVHPYMLSKLRPYAAKSGVATARRAVAVLEQADARIKSSGADPWLVLEAGLQQIATKSPPR